MAKEKEKKERIERLRDGNLTYKKIGMKLGISKQRVHQILTSYRSPSSKRARNQNRNRNKYKGTWQLKCGGIESQTMYVRGKLDYQRLQRVLLRKMGDKNLL